MGGARYAIERLAELVVARLGVPRSEGATAGRLPIYELGRAGPELAEESNPIEQQV